jgi:uncharacterized protein GlcG (DUF336 family)
MSARGTDRKEVSIKSSFGGTWWMTPKPRNVIANKGGRAMKTTKLLFGFALAVVLSAVAWGNGEAAKCNGLPSESELQAFLQAAPACVGCTGTIITGGITVGGLFNGANMWGAVVDRDGKLCAFATSTTDPKQTWPGSQAIAKAKAYTANAFSNDASASGGPLALSTALLYTFAQPGHSLFGLNNSNPFNPDLLAPTGGQGGGKNQIAGGIITFGGGVPLYNASGDIIGGLGVSGDTACADHEIAKRVRDLAALNPSLGPLVDDIVYTAPSVFLHPKCLNTFQNGSAVGNETEAPGY